MFYAGVGVEGVPLAPSPPDPAYNPLYILMNKGVFVA